jgi:hypothetical protein
VIRVMKFIRGNKGHCSYYIRVMWFIRGNKGHCSYYVLA